MHPQYINNRPAAWLLTGMVKPEHYPEGSLVRDSQYTAAAAQQYTAAAAQ